jgi:hypothetical protein
LVPEESIANVLRGGVVRVVRVATPLALEGVLRRTIVLRRVDARRTPSRRVRWVDLFDHDAAFFVILDVLVESSAQSRRNAHA